MRLFESIAGSTERSTHFGKALCLAGFISRELLPDQLPVPTVALITREALSLGSRHMDNVVRTTRLEPQLRGFGFGWADMDTAGVYLTPAIIHELSDGLRAGEVELLDNFDFTEVLTSVVILSGADTKLGDQPFATSRSHGYILSAGQYSRQICRNLQEQFGGGLVQAIMPDVVEGLFDTLATMPEPPSDLFPTGIGTGGDVAGTQPTR